MKNGERVEASKVIAIVIVFAMMISGLMNLAAAAVPVVGEWWSQPNFSFFRVVGWFFFAFVGTGIVIEIGKSVRNHFRKPDR